MHVKKAEWWELIDWLYGLLEYQVSICLRNFKKKKATLANTYNGAFPNFPTTLAIGEGQNDSSYYNILCNQIQKTY